MAHRSVYWHRFLGFFMIGTLFLAGSLLLAMGIGFLIEELHWWSILILVTIVLAAGSAMAALS